MMKKLLLILLVGVAWLQVIRFYSVLPAQVGVLYALSGQAVYLVSKALAIKVFLALISGFSCAVWVLPIMIVRSGKPWLIRLLGLSHPELYPEGLLRLVQDRYLLLGVITLALLVGCENYWILANLDVENEFPVIKIVVFLVFYLGCVGVWYHDFKRRFRF